MNLKQKIDRDRTEARVYEPLRYNILTLVKSGIEVEEKKDGKEITGDKVIEVIRHLIKLLKEANENINKATSLTEVQKQAIEHNVFQISILEEYVPALMSEEDIRVVVSQVIVDLGFTVEGIKPSDAGKIKGKVFGQLKDKADGKLVAKIVDEYINKN
jgi:uncharacterized protein YqeY